MGAGRFPEIALRSLSLLTIIIIIGRGSAVPAYYLLKTVPLPQVSSHIDGECGVVRDESERWPINREKETNKNSIPNPERPHFVLNPSVMIP